MTTPPPPPSADPLALAAWGALAVVGLGGSALCSGLETGLYTLNHARLTLRAHAPEARAIDQRLLHEIEHPQRPIAALLLGNNVFNYFGVLGLTAVLTGLGMSERMIIAINILVLTPTLLVFAESLPKDLMRQRADEWVPKLAPVLFWLERIGMIIGVLPVLLFASKLAARLTGAGSDALLGDRRRARVAALLKEGAPHGLLTDRQTALLDGALDFGRTPARDVMTPWDDTLTIKAETPRIDALARLVEHNLQRAPVIDARGAPIGVIEAAALRAQPDDALEAIVAPLPRIDGDATVREALLTLRAVGARGGLVELVKGADQPGSGPAQTPSGAATVVGFVSVRDLIRPLTGAIPA